MSSYDSVMENHSEVREQSENVERSATHPLANTKSSKIEPSREFLSNIVTENAAGTRDTDMLHITCVNV